MNFIAYDRAGWNRGSDRFTHMPSGKTLLRQRYMNQDEWNKAQLEWFRQFDGSLTVHDCPEAYSTDGRLMGTVAEICKRLEEDGVDSARPIK